MYQIEVAFRIWDQNRTTITFHDQTNGKMQWIAQKMEVDLQGHHDGQ
jgi:hypothetical protein